MSELIENGGPAFPRASFDNGNTWNTDYTGMTLRDYFAAKAMQGICAHAETWGLTVVEIVGQSYAIADAMLDARGDV